MSKWTTVRVDKETAGRLKAMAGALSVSSLLERFSLGEFGEIPADRVPSVTEAADFVKATIASVEAAYTRARAAASPPPIPRVTHEVSRTQPVAKESPFEARAHKRKAAPTYATNEFGDDTYDD